MEIEEFKALVNDMFKVKQAITRLDEEKKELTAGLNEMKAKAMVELEKGEMKSFKSGDMRITKVDKKSVKIEDRNLFLNWLEENGDLRDSLNVTAATATKIYNEHYEEAKENQDLNFLTKGIDGLSQPETYSTIQLYGGKK